mgnify:FL=1
MLDITQDILETIQIPKGINPDEWLITADYRKRGRMKINFKLSKDESEAFVNFKNQTKPDEIPEDAFLKSIFFLGISTLEANISQRIQQELEKMDEDVEIPEETSLPEEG